MRLATKRFARAATIAAAIVASSGSMATGRPLFATLREVTFNLTAGFSEVEEMRRKITEAHARGRYVQAASAIGDNGARPSWSARVASPRSLLGSAARKAADAFAYLGSKPKQRRPQRARDVSIAETAAAAATIQLEMCGSALKQHAALFRRQRASRGHDGRELIIGESDHAVSRAPACPIFNAKPVEKKIAAGPIIDRARRPGSVLSASP
jgi:hypothetical protein